MVIGFTNGIAVVIFIAQIKDFLGLAIEDLPGEFFGKMAALASHLHTIHLPTVGSPWPSLVILLGWNRLATRFPALKRAPDRWRCWSSCTAANAC